MFLTSPSSSEPQTSSARSHFGPLKQFMTRAPTTRSIYEPPADTWRRGCTMTALRTSRSLGSTRLYLFAEGATPMRAEPSLHYQSPGQIGRASCTDRPLQVVYIPLVSVSLTLTPHNPI